MTDSFLFYDLETWGTDPRRTRIAQFAAIRTDADLVELGEPIEFLGKGNGYYRYRVGGVEPNAVLPMMICSSGTTLAISS